MSFSKTSIPLLSAAVMISTLALGGCATKDYVNHQVGPMSERVNRLDRTSQEALERAKAAGKLAEGKFLFQEVLSDDSMKFETGKANLSPEVCERLDAFVDKLKAENKNVYIEVQGHTDATGTRETNYRLGEERAEAVRRYLNEHGVALNRISTISYGPDAPVAPNTDKAGRAQNRRVVLIVLT
jgi:outer membrane protein OmpA-like peptidoglycan-associated protein